MKEPSFPDIITFETGSAWNSSTEVLYYNKVVTSNAQSTTYELYDNATGAKLTSNNYDITFEINSNNEITLNVNPPTGGNSPTKFIINGSGPEITSGIVNVGDNISLYNTNNSVIANMIVPNPSLNWKMETVVLTNGQYNTELGEGFMIGGYPSSSTSVRHAYNGTIGKVEVYNYATTKEPVISMTDYNQGGYEVSASSEYTGSNFKAWQVFDNLLTGDPDYGAAHNGNWVTAANTYVLSGSDYVSKGTQLSASSSTVTGEWIKLKLPYQRKAVGYKLSRQNHTDYSRSPKQFRLYGSNDNSTWTEIVGSAQALTTTPLGSYDQLPEANGGTRFDFYASNAYQYFALVIEKCWGHNFTYVHEFQLFCVV